MNTQPPHARSIRAQLLAAMRSGEYAQCERLPRESALAVRLGISRTQLRDVLASLEREGVITRRHGVGTMINRHVLDAPTRIDIGLEILEVIRRNGYTPAVASVQVWEDHADEALAGKLRLPAGTPVLRIARLCTASGKPAVYCEDVIERALVREGYTEQDLRQPIVHFLRQFCGVYPYLDLTDLQTAAAGQKLSEILQVPPGTPLLQMDEVDYDIDGRPVFFSTQYFTSGVFRQTIMRKKL